MWVMTSCSPGCGYERFQGTHRLHCTQKITIELLTAVKISNLIYTNIFVAIVSGDIWRKSVLFIFG
jgi:hypothetical protein